MYNIIHQYDKVMKTRELNEEVPFLKFHQDWDVKIIPPFAGASVRFLVKFGNKEVSIYLDCYDNLGYYNKKPYWEVYPYEDDVFRCGMNEVQELMDAICKALS